MSFHTIAILGGTGAEGSGLALRWARAGHRVTLGSRNPEKAAKVCNELNAQIGGNPISFADNRTAAGDAAIVVLTVPHLVQRATVDEVREQIAGKILIDTTVPLVPPKVARVQLPPETSAALACQKRLGEGARVVAAFHNVAAHKLQTDAEIDCDVLIFGDNPQDRAVVASLAQAAGLRGVHAGPLANSVAAEALTSVLIGINRNYKVDGAGIRITGIS